MFNYNYKMPASKSAQKKMDVVAVTTTDTETKKTKGTKGTTPTQTVTDTTPTTVKTTKGKATKKDVVETTPATTTTTTPVAEVENVVVTADSVETNITDSFSEFITKFQGMVTNFNSLKTELRALEKKTVKQLKVVQKLNQKKKRKGSRAPSGFVKPAPISDELAQFLGKPQGSEMARTDVTREINKYIRANNLQDKDNGRKIIPDKALATLLKIGDDVNLTYFNLQRYMGPHFPKQTKVEATA